MNEAAIKIPDGWREIKKIIIAPARITSVINSIVLPSTPLTTWLTSFVISDINLDEFDCKWNE